ncbi:MAG: nucleoside deaminase [Candidatus Paceibacterota bacterium]|jgi:tRNA(Arg) A34 adenosine deaminase TadA
MIRPNKKFMELAIKAAKRSRDIGDYAIGAVLAKNGKVIAVCGNRAKTSENSSAHAEVLAITKANKIMKSRHLKDCILYTTHEPCPMCASLAVWAKLKGVVYGASYKDMKEYHRKHANKKYLWRTIDIPCKDIFNKSPENIEVVKGFMRGECIKLFHDKI